MTGSKAPLTAAEIKNKAQELGAHLVGIADGTQMELYPPDPDEPRRPSDITDRDGERVIVMGYHINTATSRLPDWNHQHKFYNDELTLTALEEMALNLVFWLESKGSSAIVIPANMINTDGSDFDPTQHQKPVLSLDHAAVEAGLGTLGLNEQILTPEFGPRVKLISVLCSADVEADQPMAEALCKGPECGRCLQACPADAVGHWQRDWNECDKYRVPYGFVQTMEFLEKMLSEQDLGTKVSMLRSGESYQLWTGIMRGAGVITGCRRCQDVCPVGADYEAMIGDVLEEIAENSEVKDQRLAEMTASAQSESPEKGYQSRWIGKLPS